MSLEECVARFQNACDSLVDACRKAAAAESLANRAYEDYEDLKKCRQVPEKGEAW